MGFDHGVMKAIQGLSVLGPRFMDGLFIAATFLGEEIFLLVVVLGIYWSVDKRRGEYLLLALYTAIASNGMVKDWFRRPRPFLTPGFEDLRYLRLETPLVDTVHLAGSHSFPSGHAQCAGSLFSGLWLSADRRRGRGALLALGAVLLVMASRVYLGVHFPTDTLVGAGLGLLASLIGWGLFQRFYHHRLLVFGAVVALSCSALLLEELSSDTVKTIGLGVGAFLGLLLERKWVDFRVGGTLGGRILRVVLGAALLMGVRAGLSLVLPRRLIFDALRYGLVGLTATGLWPWCFKKIGL